MSAPTTAERGRLAKIKDETAYYPHQVEGIRTGARMNSLLLADDMGLGKSLQALTIAAIDFEQGWATRVLIVAPASLKWNWQAEIEQHTHFTATVLDGTPRQRDAQLDAFEADGTDILIVNYEQVLAHLEQLNALAFDIVIFDEAHAMKNPKAKRTKACLKLNAKRFFVLTGSPVLNKVDELWTLLHRIDPDGFPSYWSFIQRYAVFGGFKDKQIIGVKNEGDLRTRLQSVMIRRRKSEVLDLPDKQHITVTVGLHPTQRELYVRARDELIIDLPDDPDPMEIENALTRFLRLKQICGTPQAVDETLPDHSFKLDRAVEMVEQVISEGEHVVVFTQFRGVQAAMARRLAKARVGTYLLNGDTPMAERVPTVRAWAQSEPAAMVAMLQVAGVGLNMTAARTAIFLDKLFVPKLNEQAEDRIHRIGADKDRAVQIYQLLCKGTVEARIEQILAQKKRLFDSLVEESDWKKALIGALREQEDEL